MKIFSHPHEKVVHFHDPKAGLKAIVAIFSTRRGPALGGLRMFKYADEEEALTDCLRLAEAMAFKAAAAELPLGGGKGVILADPAKDKSKALYESFGTFLESLNGEYITAEDSGSTQEDMAIIATKSRYVTGKPRKDGKRGDPAPPTAMGLFLSIQATLKSLGRAGALKDMHVAIQGTGMVGSELARHLHGAGAKLTVSDIDAGRAKEVSEKYGAKVVAPDKIHAVAADIFSPCALGAVLNDKTIPQIKAKIVLGAANNQLLDVHKHSKALARRGILYLPDYVVNAGGLIQLYVDMQIELGKSFGKASVENIPGTVSKILSIAKQKGCTPHEASHRLALSNLE